MDGGCADIVSSVKDIPEAGGQRLAAEVLAAISAVRRVARRAARSAWPAQPLPPAQSELLQLAAARPGISVADAARELRLAPNTGPNPRGVRRALGPAHGHRQRGTAHRRVA
jgi:hypothetical protein